MSNARGFVRRKLRQGCTTEARLIRGVGLRLVLIDPRGRTIAVLPKHYMEAVPVESVI